MCTDLCCHDCECRQRGMPQDAKKLLESLGLIVLDPGSATDTEKMFEALKVTASRVHMDRAQAVMLRLKPVPEPRRPLAVVKDARGAIYTRVSAVKHQDYRWETYTEGEDMRHVRFAWSELRQPVTVIFEGVDE